MSYEPGWRTSRFEKIPSNYPGSITLVVSTTRSLYWWTGGLLLSTLRKVLSDSFCRVGTEYGSEEITWSVFVDITIPDTSSVYILFHFDVAYPIIKI